MKGNVKFFNERKNYGFIESEKTNNDLFVHRDNILVGNISDGDRVSFSLAKSHKGPRAVKVRRTSKKTTQL